MKKILVTGSSGFTGRYVCDVFRERGYEVIGVSRVASDDDAVACDLSDYHAVRELVRRVQPDGVVHLAALAFVGHQDEMAFYNVNVFGTQNLLRALEECDIRPEKVIVASSANVYGAPSDETISEGLVPNPVNHYAISKLAMEYMAKTWFSKFPILITRPFNYTGPGQSSLFLVPKIVKHFKEKKPVIELGNLDVERDFSDVRDVALAYLELYESGVYSELVNISSGKTYQLSEIVELMNNIAGYEIEVQVNPEFVRPNEIKILRGDNSKLVRLTGYQPSISFAQTLQDMYTF